MQLVDAKHNTPDPSLILGPHARDALKLREHCKALLPTCSLFDLNQAGQSKHRQRLPLKLNGDAPWQEKFISFPIIDGAQNIQVAQFCMKQLMAWTAQMRSLGLSRLV